MNTRLDFANMASIWNWSGVTITIKFIVSHQLTCLILSVQETNSFVSKLPCLDCESRQERAVGILDASMCDADIDRRLTSVQKILSPYVT